MRGKKKEEGDKEESLVLNADMVGQQKKEEMKKNK